MLPTLRCCTTVDPCDGRAHSGVLDIIVNKKRHERRRQDGLCLLPLAGGGWEGGTARTGCPQSSRPPRLPPSCLPPLGGGPKPWPWGGGVSSACASLLFPIMSVVSKRKSWARSGRGYSPSA